MYYIFLKQQLPFYHADIMWNVKVKWLGEYDELNQYHFIFQPYFLNLLKKFLPLSLRCQGYRPTTNQLWFWATGRLHLIEEDG